jgi:pimeloyl-ACP methyl ester carboxylesterase
LGGRQPVANNRSEANSSAQREVGSAFVTTINYHRGGHGPPLLLIHGIGSRWQMWNPVLERLQRERDVIAIDAPGFGDSPRPPAGIPAGIASLTRLVIEFLDELGLERPHVGGNSMGGWLGLELAKAGRASSVTALSPAGFHNDRERRFVELSLRSTFRAGKLLRPIVRSLTSTAAGRMIVWQYFGRPWLMTPDQAAAELRAVADATWFDETLGAMLGDRFSGGELIEAPVTIAWGQRDRLLFMRQAPRAGAAIPGAKLVTLYGCGHVPTYDDPEQVAKVLLGGSSE